MASSAGRSEPMDAEGKGPAIKACFEFQERAPASFRKDKNRHWVSWTVVPQDLSKLLAGGVDLEQLRRSEEHTSELQSRSDLVCRLLLEKKKHIPRQLTLLSLPAQSRPRPSPSHLT